MEYRYEPKGVCSYEMIIEVDGDTIKKVNIKGGCAGNTVGVSRLVEGMQIDEAIKRLKGIPCGMRGTSCPDQLARALEEIKPQWFLLENNASMTQENKDRISEILGCRPVLINSADFSAQNRNRRQTFS